MAARDPAGWVRHGVILTRPGGATVVTRRRLANAIRGGARWAVERGWGLAADLDRIEEQGRMQGAKPACVSAEAKNRQRDEMSTLGSGNHYLEVQEVTAVYDAQIAAACALTFRDIVVTIHCVSRGLGHQIGTEFLKAMAIASASHGICLPDRELACAPITSDVGEHYLGAMRAAINCALAIRQILTHLVRKAVTDILPRAPAASVRRVAQHLQARSARRRRQRDEAVRSSQRRDTRFRAGTCGVAEAVRRRRPARADRWLDG